MSQYKTTTFNSKNEVNRNIDTKGVIIEKVTKGGGIEENPIISISL